MSEQKIPRADKEDDFSDMEFEEIEIEEPDAAPKPKPKPIELHPARIDLEAARSAHACGCRNLAIIAPAGRCPHKLVAVDPDVVVDWANKVVESGHAIGRHYVPAALRYFAREFFDLSSDQYRQVYDQLVNFGCGNVQMRGNPNCPDHLRFTDSEGYCISCGEK